MKDKKISFENTRNKNTSKFNNEGIGDDISDKEDHTE